MSMQMYGDLNGNSGIVAYEIFHDAIDVEFESGGVYTYTQASVGDVYFSVMATLANAGVGLNAFINKHVRFRYANRRPLNTPPPPPTPAPPVCVHVDSENAVPVITQLLKAGVKVSLN